jgi:Rps23 Pro-64 3,4-dihydroxylase Tpa1-like proline 4-hydroxylase
MLVIENAINSNLLRATWATWPGHYWNGWYHYSGVNAEKYATKSKHDVPHAAMACIMEMITVASDHVIPESFPDLDLHGAGLHMIPQFGYLRPHLDSSYMESTGWKREYSCVLSVNPEWNNWGGKFILQGEEVAPKFNQLILFRTTEDSIHEVTDVKGPYPRCTLAVFFWSKNRDVNKSRPSAKFFT